MLKRLLAFLIGLSLIGPSLQEDEKVEKIFQSIENSKGANLESASRELIDLGPSAIEAVRRGIKRADLFVRIAAANYLYNFDQYDEAVSPLLAVSCEKNTSVSKTAARLLATLLDTDKKLDKSTQDKYSKNIKTTTSKVTDEATRVYLYKAHYILTQSLDPKRSLRDILRTSKDKDVKAEAALILAEIDDHSFAKEYLKDVAKESGERGKLARAYLKIGDLETKIATAVFNNMELNELKDKVKALEQDKKDLTDEIAELKKNIDKLAEEIKKWKEKKPDKNFPPLALEQDQEELLKKLKHYEERYKLLDEIIERLKLSYQNPSKVDIDKLIEKAAKGLLNSLDPYSTYYEKDEYAKIKKEEMEGKYGGIGARVTMRRDRNGNTWLTITDPFFTGPAFKTGLRAGDRIVEIEGEVTANQDLDELVRKLRGVPGTDVKIKYQRYGFEKPKELVITRKEIHVESVNAEMLPGEIGFISLRRFGRNDDVEIRKAIEALKEKGMKALIIDLRGNPGGLLETCLRMINLFIKKDLVSVIIDTKGKQEKRWTDKDPLTDVPITILVDGGSASASEILSGTLKAYERAKLVGEKTYGKGTVQNTYLLKATDEKSAMKFTVSKWLLPDGKPVDHEEKAKAGIQPDFEVPYPEREPYVDKELEKLRESQAIEKYFFENFEKNREIFEKLAVNDKKDASLYPNFEEFYKTLNTKVEKEWVRRTLREHLRQKFAEEKQKHFLTDTEDIQLQKAITEVAKIAKIDLSKIDEYSFFVKPSQNQ